MSNRYKLAVFDMDGTILNTLDDLCASTNAALKANNLPERTLDEVKFFVGNGVRLLIERAVPEGTDSELIDKVFADFKADYSIHSADNTRPYPGIVELIRLLKKSGIKTAVVSNKPDKAVKDLCDEYFKGLFDAAIGENEAAGIRKKPAKDEVDLAIMQIGIDPREAVYIGDSDVDVQTAVNSGLDMIAVTWGFRDKRFLISHGATLFADNTDELANLILGCKYASKCGGCSYQDKSYAYSLLKKQREMDKLLGEFGKVRPIIGMDIPLYYRNKVHHVFGYDKKHGTYSGFYEQDSHRIVRVDSCIIEDKNAGAVIRTIEELLKSFKIKTFDEDTGFGLFRHVLIRTGHETNQMLVVLVLSSPILPSKNNFVKALLKKHPEITSIVLNVNDKKTSMVLGERNIPLYGKGYIEDILCGKRFRISPNSFYQVNPIQTEILYNTAINLAELKKKETVLDAYCGIGTIGMIASDRVNKVIGVELNKSAVKDAIYGAKANGVNNIEFVCADASEYIVKLAESGESVDVVIMDPPRSGSTEVFLSSVVKLAPKKVVYISCGPDTLARDLKYLTKHGYVTRKIQPVDLFPFTNHVETVCLLVNQNVKS